MSELISVTVPHPGRILKRELDARGWTTRWLRYPIARSDIPFDPVAYFEPIVAEQKDIDAEAAYVLAYRLGTSKQFWLNLQVNYDRHIANTRNYHEHVP